MVRDLTFLTEDSAKTWIAYSRVGRVVSSLVVEVREGGEGELGALRFSVGVARSTEVVGGGMSDGNCEEGVGYGSEWIGCCTGGVWGGSDVVGCLGGMKVTSGSGSGCDGY